MSKILDRMSGSNSREDVTSPSPGQSSSSRPGSVIQEENNDGVSGAEGGEGSSDYSSVAQRTVANIRRLQDNVCSQYVQSVHVSSSGSSHVSQYEQDNWCDLPQQPPDNLEMVTLSPLRVSLPSPPPSP